MMQMLVQFHFLRPLWLLVLFPLLLLLGWMWQRRLTSQSWQRVVDPQLLAHLLIGKAARQGPWAMVALGVGGVLAILALAGPAWQKLPQPVFRQQSARVVVFDLSRSMDATDVKPSRLERAKLKLRDILNQQKEGETALIVYAATPFVVSPLTTDAQTIASQIEVLSPDLMPAQGSHPASAIALAQQLLQQAGVAHGGVLLMTDGLNGNESPALKTAIQNLVNAGHRLSVMGVGTPAGAPIPNPAGGFIQDDSGAIVIPKLDDTSLEALASQGHGAYRRLSSDDSDYLALLAPFKHDAGQAVEVNGQLSDQWRDEGPWLLLPLMLLGALAFRRGYLVMLLLVMLPQTHPAYAFGWDSLWQRDDQRGQQAMDAKQPKLAAQLFHDPQWRAAANYKAGNYPAALDNLKGIDNARADYNRGNALAQLGKYAEAVQAYDAALKRDPKLADAQFNRNLVEALIKKQQQQAQKNQPQSPQHNPSQAGQSDKSGTPEPGAGQPSPQSGTNKQPAKQSKPSQSNSSTHSQTQAGEQSAQQAAGKSGQPNQANPAQQQAGAAQPQPGQAQPQQPNAGNAQAAADTPQTDQLKPADKQWLQRIPDDPGGLWRRKFLYQYKREQAAPQNEAQPW